MFVLLGTLRRMPCTSCPLHCPAPRSPAAAVPPKAGTHGPQVALYDRCLRRWGKHHTFMAFIDTDEFLVLRDGTPDMPTLVRAAGWWANVLAGRQAGAHRASAPVLPAAAACLRCHHACC